MSWGQGPGSVAELGLDVESGFRCELQVALVWLLVLHLCLDTGGRSGPNPVWVEARFAFRLRFGLGFRGFECGPGSGLVARRVHMVRVVRTATAVRERASCQAYKY